MGHRVGCSPEYPQNHNNASISDKAGTSQPNSSLRLFVWIACDPVIIIELQLELNGWCSHPAAFLSSTVVILKLRSIACTRFATFMQLLSYKMLPTTWSPVQVDWGLTACRHLSLEVSWVTGWNSSLWSDRLLVRLYRDCEGMPMAALPLGVAHQRMPMTSSMHNLLFNPFTAKMVVCI